MPTSIHDLPVETLARVFVSMLSIDVPPTFPLALRLVCRHWHEVSEQTSGLWSGLIGRYGRRWAERALELSRNSSLDIVLDAQGTTLERWTLEYLILQQLHRIRTLKFTTHEISHKRVKKALKTSATLLEELAISGQWSGPPTDLSGAFFHPTPPRLSHLSLTRARMTADFPPLSSPLTHLCLDSCSGWRSIDEILTMLSNLPRLRSFKWKRALSATVPRPSAKPYEQHIELPDLEDLEMSDMWTVIIGVSSRILFPPTCDIVLSIDISHSIYTIGTNLLRTSLNIGVLPHLKAAFDDRENGFSDLQIFDSVEEYGFTARWSNPRLSHVGPAKFELSLFGRADFEARQSDALFHVLEQWPGIAAHVARLTVHHNSFCDDARTWSGLFNRIGNIDHLTAGGAAVKTLCTALSEAEEQLPRLTQLTLKDGRLAKSTYHQFIGLMEGRRQDVNQSASRPPRKISFVECNIMGEKTSRTDVMLRG